MLSGELQIVLINLAIILLAYFGVYPRFCGADLNKILVNDAIATVVALVVAGSLFAGSDARFTLLFGEVNWFWFTLLTYFLMETPFMFWYFKRFGIWPGGEK